MADFEAEDYPERPFWRDKWDFIKPRLSELMVGSDKVLEASSKATPWINLPGIYFAIFRDRIVYVGQAGSISCRVSQHLKEGRPIERLAFIVGLPPWVLDEIEHAYIRAWHPPWNAEKKRSGCLYKMPELQDAANALDKSAIGTWPESVRVPHVNFKAWQLHVMGWYQQQQASEG